MRWYAMIEEHPRKYIGHNPLAMVSMHILFVWVGLFMIVTGFALYGEGEGRDGFIRSLPARSCGCLAACRRCTPGTIWRCGRW
jgi:Ni,Fe-hydrogenase I cytochrome b subunit